MPLTPSTLITTFAALALVLGAALLAAHLARRAGFTRRSGTARLALRETLALDRTRTLHLVSCDGRELLILAAPSGAVPVGWLPDVPGTGVAP